MNEPCQAPARCDYCGREHPAQTTSGAGAPTSCIECLNQWLATALSRITDLSDRVTELEHPGWRAGGSFIDMDAQP